MFEGLSIWEEEEYQKLQGTFPVIFVSFAGVKSGKLQGAKDSIVNAIANAYEAHSYLKKSNMLNEDEKREFDRFKNYGTNLSMDRKIPDVAVSAAIQTLSMYLERNFGRKVMILLDEYDTPLQEAYVSGYWREMVAFIRELFNMTFKTNPFLEKALLTGITRVSKESIFSDLNHLEVVTTTSEKYCTSFGFTEADTSSNRLVSELIRKGSPKLKMQMEGLLAGDCVEVVLEEQVVFDQLFKKKGAIWSLLVASGYLKPVSSYFLPTKGETWYQLMITNFETKRMFRSLISDWFSEDFTPYSDFKKALLLGDLYYMNRFMNEVSKEMFSSFDVGNRPSDAMQPERFPSVKAITKGLTKPNPSACFYHGFVLGLIVDLSDRYWIRSNRESGFGRYDVIMEPKDQKDDAMILEFKVRNPDREQIRSYGFAFEGKKVLIGQAPKE